MPFKGVLLPTCRNEHDCIGKRKQGNEDDIHNLHTLDADLSNNRVLTNYMEGQKAKIKELVVDKSRDQECRQKGDNLVCEQEVLLFVFLGQSLPSRLRPTPLSLPFPPSFSAQPFVPRQPPPPNPRQALTPLFVLHGEVRRSCYQHPRVDVAETIPLPLAS